MSCISFSGGSQEVNTEIHNAFLWIQARVPPLGSELSLARPLLSKREGRTRADKIVTKLYYYF